MIRIGLIGAGGIGGMGSIVVKHFLAEEGLAGLVAVADLHESRAREKAEGSDATIYHGENSGFDLIRDKNVDLVLVATPTDTHAQFGIAAAEAGKNLFLQKPLERTVEEGERIVAAVKEAGVECHVGYVLPSWPEYTAITDFVREHGVTITSVKAGRLSPFPGWGDYGQGNWFAQEARSGGARLDLATHDTLYIMKCLFDGQMPYAVEARGTHVPELGGWSKDLRSTFYFRNGQGEAVEAFTECTFGRTEDEGFTMYLEVEGTVGEGGAKHNVRIVYNSDTICETDETLLVAEEGHPIVFPDIATVPELQVTGTNISNPGGYYFELKNYLAHLDGREARPIVTADEGLTILRLTEVYQNKAMRARELVQIT